MQVTGQQPLLSNALQQSNDSSRILQNMAGIAHALTADQAVRMSGTSTGNMNVSTTASQQLTTGGALVNTNGPRMGLIHGVSNSHMGASSPFGMATMLPHKIGSPATSNASGQHLSSAPSPLHTQTPPNASPRQPLHNALDFPLAPNVIAPNNPDMNQKLAEFKSRTAGVGEHQKSLMSPQEIADTMLAQLSQADTSSSKGGSPPYGGTTPTDSNTASIVGSPRPSSINNYSTIGGATSNNASRGASLTDDVLSPAAASNTFQNSVSGVDHIRTAGGQGSNGSPAGHRSPGVSMTMSESGVNNKDINSAIVVNSVENHVNGIDRVSQYFSRTVNGFVWDLLLQ